MAKRIVPASHYQRRDAPIRMLADQARPAIQRDLKAALKHLPELVDGSKVIALINSGNLSQVKDAVKWGHFREILKAPFGRMAELYGGAADYGVKQINGKFGQAGRRVRFHKAPHDVSGQPRDWHGRWTTGGGAVGLAASGLEDAERIKAEWVQANPIDTADKIMARGKVNQEELNRVAGILAETNGAEWVNPGIKTRESLDRKLATGRPAASITDAVRGGFKVATPKQSDTLVRALARNFTIVDEGWQRVVTGYFDRKVIIRFNDGSMGEVQFWHPGIFDAKERGGGHALYENWRVSTDSRERAILVSTMNTLYAGVRISSDWNAVAGRGGT